VLESIAIGAQGSVIVHATGHVSPVAGLDFAVCRFFEIEDVQRLRRTGDHFGSFAWILSEAALLEERGHSAKRSNIRTGSKEL